MKLFSLNLLKEVPKWTTYTDWALAWSASCWNNLISCCFQQWEYVEYFNDLYNLSSSTYLQAMSVISNQKLFLSCWKCTEKKIHKIFSSQSCQICLRLKEILKSLGKKYISFMCTLHKRHIIRFCSNYSKFLASKL